MASATEASPASYLIIGAGVFGASTALHLARRYPAAHVMLVDRDAYAASTRVAASWDWNKVVRADYRDVAYVRLALEARALWREDPLWRPFYHESGIWWVSQSDFARQVLRNFRDVKAGGGGGGEEAEMGLMSVSVDASKGMCGGLFADADYSGIDEVLINKMSGWADAKDVLRRVIEEAVALGVEYVQAEVAALEFDQAGTGCTGIRTKEGEVLRADRVLLCTGAYTAKLLVDSAPERAELQAGGRIIAAGVTEAIAPLVGEKDRAAFADMPVAIQENPPERGASNGCLPPNKDNVLKYWGQHIFSNTLEHSSTGQNMSMPPPGSDYSQWEVPEALKDDVRFANKAIFGRRGEGLELEKFRICWEALTPSGDFIISPHPACANLYIATCGSFHGWKFFPVLGKYVVQMLEGALDPALRDKWAWDRELPPVERNRQWPRKELRDFV